MKSIIEYLKGKKTYVALFVGGLVILANAFIGIEIPGVQLNPETWSQDLWALLVAAFVRAGIAKV